MLKERIQQVVEEKFGEEIYIVEIKASDQSQKVMVYVDTDTGITLDQVTAVTRHLGKWLEEEDPIEHKFTLDVSSPGLARSLVLKRQYKKNIGRNVWVDTPEGSQEGELVYVDDEKIILKQQKKKEVTEREVRFDEIRKAKVVI